MKKLQEQEGPPASSSRLDPAVDVSGVAVIILTRNEELNMDAALDSVCGWADQIFVVDSYSTDKTVDLARKRSSDGVVVVQHVFEDFSSQWNWALANLPISAPFTLKLDADERVTSAFKQELATFLPHARDVEGIYFRRLIHFMGKPLRWGGMTDNYDLRMWRTGRAAFDGRRINEHARVCGRTHKLTSLVEHRDYKSITEWIAKHNGYSSAEAASLEKGDMHGGVAPRFLGTPEERRMWLRTVYFRLPLRPLLHAAYRLIFRLGVLDGVAGIRYAVLYAGYLYWIDLKRLEMRTCGTVGSSLAV